MLHLLVLHYKKPPTELEVTVLVAYLFRPFHTSIFKIAISQSNW